MTEAVLFGTCSAFTMRIFGVVDLQYKSECGVEITLGHNRYSLLYPDSYSAFLDRYTKGISRELHEFLNIHRQEGLPFREFVCTGCGKTRIAEKPPDRFRLKCLASLAFTAGLEGVEMPLNHWCDNPACTQVHGDSVGEIQDALSKSDLNRSCTGIFNFNKMIEYKSKLPNPGRTPQIAQTASGQLRMPAANRSCLFFEQVAVFSA